MYNKSNLEMKDGKHLISNIQSQCARLSKGQKLIAQYILKNYDKVALYNFWYQLTPDNKKEVIKQILFYIKNALSKIKIRKENVEYSIGEIYDYLDI